VCGVLVAVLSGCVTAPVPSTEPKTPDDARFAVVRTAESLVGKKQFEWNGQRFNGDCVGFVRLVYAENGIDLYRMRGRSSASGVETVFEYVRHFGSIHQDSPRPGDLVFFHDTYDRNRDGLVNDGLTHIGIVKGVESDGTVEVIHRVQRGVVRYRMNIAHPLDRTRDGRVINDYLRRDHDGHSVTAGELFAAYATVIL